MIEWMITSSAMILLVLLLRALVKNRVSPRLRYALWGLALLRLLVPGTLWESPASVMAGVAEREIYQEIERVPRYVRDRPDGWVEIGHQNGYTAIPEENIEAGKPVHYGWPPVESDLEDLRKQVGIRDALWVVWLAGAVLTGAFLLAVNLRFGRRLKKHRRTLGQYRGRWVFVKEGLATPCLFGLFCPGIYLTPEVAADETAREHVLAHEYTHFRQGDHIWAALRGVCLALHWYNPLVWLAAYLSRRDCELSCDEGAVRLLGEASRADYGRTLVGLAAGRTTPRDLACCATTMTGGKSALKERVALLVKRPRTRLPMAVLVATACVVFAACTFTGAKAEEQDSPEEPVRTEHEPEGEPIDLPEEPPAVLTEDLPALEDLPTALTDVPAASQDPIWLVAELRSDDIAVYYEAETDRSFLRYGDALQALDLGGRSITTPRLLFPTLYFEDLDGDGAKELAIIYNSDSGTGVSVWSLTVFEWDGGSWTGYTARLEEEIINDFNTSRNLALHPDENYVTVSFRDSRVDVDMDAMSGGRTLWKEEPLFCEITGAISAYKRQSYGLTLTLEGELRPESYAPATSYGFSYTCDVHYDGDGIFRAAMGWLDTEYRWVPKADGSFLTPAFRDILQQFIGQCRAEGMADLSTERYAICDVNGDGENELITQRNNTYMAGQAERVYNADGTELLAAYPLVTYYDNGYAQAGWSHNQGAAGDKLWPYTLFKYDGDAGKYAGVASVDGWDKRIRDAYLSYDESVIPFPDGVDKDGDGFVYYVIEEEGGYAPVYGEPMDYADYALWVARYLGANAVEPSYIPLTEENIALIG